jgi:RimJ/RimL family protein N-acetyltransferase
MSVELLPFRRDDFASLISWAASPAALVDWAGGSFSYPLDDGQLERHLAESGASRRLAFTARDPDTEEPIGHLELTDVDQAQGSANIVRVVVDPRRRREGIGTAMMSALLDEAFLELGLHRVALRVFETNREAIGWYRKLGFVEEGVLRDVALFGDRYRSAMVMSVREHEWLSRRELGLLVTRARAPAPVFSRAQWGAARPGRPYRPLGPLRALILHHTSLPADELERGFRAEAAHMREIQRLHLSRGWTDVGYHFVIAPSGRIFGGRPPGALGAHARGYNRGALGVALAGDFEVERPTEAALRSLGLVLARLVPGARVVPLLGHRDVADTVCPGRFLYPYVEARRGAGTLAGPTPAAPVRA